MKTLELGYIIAINRETHKFEEVSTKVNRYSATEYVQTEARLNNVSPGGLHAEYYNVAFVKEEDIEEVRDLICRYNTEQDASTVIGFCFNVTIIKL